MVVLAGLQAAIPHSGCPIDPCERSLRLGKPYGENVLDPDGWATLGLLGKFDCDLKRSTQHTRQIDQPVFLSLAFSKTPYHSSIY